MSAVFALLATVWFARRGTTQSIDHPETQTPAVHVEQQLEATPPTDRTVVPPEPESDQPSVAGSLQGSADSEMAAWGPWRQMRLDEVDRAVEAMRAHSDPTMRQLDLQFVIIVCVSPLADEMGLSELGSAAAQEHPRLAGEHTFVSNRRYYRIPAGIFPLLDDFMTTWEARNERRAKLSQAEESRFDETEPFPLDLFSIQRLEELAERARAAIRRRTEAY